MAVAVLEVPGISCDHCARSIRGALEPSTGVTSVDVDVAGKTVTVEFDASVVGVEAMRAALAEEEFEVVGARVS